ncbi:hypothetical protein [Helicobacter trogontum]|uniref:Outer membrane beta-barrel protein n=1 Tax=Helicobacter trogontum TaxID=50960 RepID=A0A4U8TB90_9HELI|nr:hypothetical protein [Helicobacter trogontum]MDY5184629.1 hypothetical protein [Helicobacter trogontum]TLD97135.1 hypothetical protein LS80_007120 [Helicobacter trogontum]SFZ72657.1 OMP1526 [Helicobacter trogontum]
MKKMLALGLLSLSLAQAKVFVGIDGGYVMAGSAPFGKTNSSVWNGNYRDAWSVSANFGYESLFSNHFGARAFISAGYGNVLDSALTNQFITVDGNIDLMINFVPSFGIFAGVGAGYQYHNVYKEHGIPLFGRAGVTFGITEHLRLDLTARLPIITWEAKDSLVGLSMFSPLTVQAGIKFLF